MSKSDLLGYEELQELSVEDLLELPLDMIADAEGFVLPPIGRYHLLIEESKLGKVGSGDNEFQAVQLMMEVKSTIELEDSEATPVEEGAKFSQTFGAGGALQFFKTNYGPLGPQIGASTVAELIEKLNGVEINALITHRADKKDRSIKYPRVEVEGLV